MSFKFGPLQRKWLRLLESDLYWQGQGQLCSVEGGKCYFCCLGLLADQVLKVKSHFNDVFNLFTYGGRDGFLSNQEIDQIGLISWKADKLMEMNDRDGMTFKEIAAAIRAEPEAYFLKSV